MTQAEREITTSRVIAAPRETVFRAFSDPEQLAKWWGPVEFGRGRRCCGSLATVR